MSFGEIIIILLVALLVIKPEDLPAIIKQFNKLQNFFTKAKDDLLSQINQTIDPKELAFKEDLEEINFYMEKIINLEGKYEGSYELKEVKKKYKELMNKEIAHLKLSEESNKLND